jgi:hypothetical protein
MKFFFNANKVSHPPKNKGIFGGGGGGGGWGREITLKKFGKHFLLSEKRNLRDGNRNHHRRLTKFNGY